MGENTLMHSRPQLCISPVAYCTNSRSHKGWLCGYLVTAQHAPPIARYCSSINPPVYCHDKAGSKIKMTAIERTETEATLQSVFSR